MSELGWTIRDVRVEKVAMRLRADRWRLLARDFWSDERRALSRRRLMRYFARKVAKLDAQPVDTPVMEVGQSTDDFISDRWSVVFSVRAVHRGELPDRTRVAPGIHVVRVPEVRHSRIGR